MYIKILTLRSKIFILFTLSTNSILKLHILSAPTDYFVKKRAYVFILIIKHWIQDTIANDKLLDLILGMKSKRYRITNFLVL